MHPAPSFSSLDSAAAVMVAGALGMNIKTYGFWLCPLPRPGLSTRQLHQMPDPLFLLICVSSSIFILISPVHIKLDLASAHKVVDSSNVFCDNNMHFKCLVKCLTEDLTPNIGNNYISLSYKLNNCMIKKYLYV